MTSEAAILAAVPRTCPCGRANWGERRIFLGGRDDDQIAAVNFGHANTACLWTTDGRTWRAEIIVRPGMVRR
jgi:hypothetical protein